MSSTDRMDGKNATTDGKKDYSVSQEDGREEFLCNFCDIKSSTQKGIRTHITVKHKAVKSGKDPQTSIKEPSLEAGDSTMDGFDFDDVPKSTQTSLDETGKKEITTDEILAMYDNTDVDADVEESVIHVGNIPDDTIDKVMSEMEEPESMETNDENKTVGSESTKRLERENEELKKSIDSYKTKIDEMEINVLNSQIEVSALTDSQRKFNSSKMKPN